MPPTRTTAILPKRSSTATAPFCRTLGWRPGPGQKRLWLTHYSPIITDPEEARPAAAALFPPVECGFDGKQIILQYDEETS